MKNAVLLQAALIKVMDTWLEDNIDAIEDIWLGENLTVLMAEAAMAVIKTADDTTKVISENGYLKENDA